MPRITIGIPTYNRAAFLRRALAAALDQTCPDVEALVSDNASTDETPDVVRSFGDRVRYHRNPENMGVWPNFVRLVELAEGEHFLWLQDDDLIHQDFARRAVAAFALSEEIVVYAAYALKSPTTALLYQPILLGPLATLDWMRPGTPRVLDGQIVAPLSLFQSFAIPPAVAFRTRVLRDAVAGIDPGCPLYNERIILSVAAAEGKVAVDPWPAAIFLAHEDQAHLQQKHSAPDAESRQWTVLADRLCRLLERQEDRWRLLLEQLFGAMAVAHRLQWLNYDSPPAQVWRNAHPLAARIRELLVESLPPEARSGIHDRESPLDPSPPPPGLLKTAIREVLPPIALRGLQGLRRLASR